MYGLKAQAVALMKVPIDETDQTAGPSFEWMPSAERNPADASIRVTRRGPYLLQGAVEIDDASGDVRATSGVWCLCRCGGSRSEPFCDGTHATIDFDGTETADHGDIPDRRESYVVDDELTVYDDKTRCAHFGQCTDRLPDVFGGDPRFVKPGDSDPDRLADVVSGCPSGALAYAAGADPQPVEVTRPAAVRPIVDGPYRIVGGLHVTASDGDPYEIRQRQTLCRCSQSTNKPFCTDHTGTPASKTHSHPNSNTQTSSRGTTLTPPNADANVTPSDSHPNRPLSDRAQDRSPET